MRERWRAVVCRCRAWFRRRGWAPVREGQLFARMREFLET